MNDIVETPGEAGQGGDTQNQGAGDPWYGAIQDEGLRGWAENKKFESPEVALKSYHNLEQMFGADKAGRTVEIPKSDADQTIRDEFFNKLGRPESADKYDFGELPDNADSGFVDWARGTFHKHGLSDAQAKEIVGEYNQMVAGREETSFNDSAAAFEKEEADLKKDWGAAYDENLNRGKQAAREFGLSGETITAMEKSAGYSEVMKFMANVGSKLGEGPFVGDDGGKGFGGAMTPAQASHKMAELKGDKAWMADYLSGSKTHLEQMDRLQQMATSKS